MVLWHWLDCTVHILRRGICGYALVHVPNKVSRQINQCCYYRNNLTFHNFVADLMMMMIIMIMVVVVVVVVNLYFVNSYRQVLKIHKKLPTVSYEEKVSFNKSVFLLQLKNGVCY
jgi:uncharacterized membrane protein